MTSARHSLLGLLLVFALPLFASAAGQPSEVRGVRAERQGTTIVVSWESAGDDIASYRVYWSTASILKNAGDYDDHEETANAETTLTVTNAPQGDVYVAVIAVGADGSESPAFAEEALTKAAASSSRDRTPELHALKVTAIDATHLRVIFNVPIALSLVADGAAVTVTGPKNEAVAVRSLTLDDSSLVVETAALSAGQHRLTLSKTAFFGIPKTGDRLAVFANDGQLSFISLASASSKATSSAPTAVVSSSSQAATNSVAQSSREATATSSQATVTAPGRTSSSSQSSVVVTSPIRSLTLVPYAREDGYLDIDLQWTLDPTVVISNLAVAQSIDGGQTFGPWQPTPAEPNEVRILRIPAGTFAVSMVAMYPDGSASPAVLRLLSGTTPSSSSSWAPTRPLTGSITETDSPLTSSGPASIALTLILTGAAAGAAFSRRVLPQR